MYSEEIVACRSKQIMGETELFNSKLMIFIVYFFPVPILAASDLIQAIRKCYNSRDLNEWIVYWHAIWLASCLVLLML